MERPRAFGTAAPLFKMRVHNGLGRNAHGRARAPRVDRAHSTHVRHRLGRSGTQLRIPMAGPFRFVRRHPLLRALALLARATDASRGRSTSPRPNSRRACPPLRAASPAYCCRRGRRAHRPRSRAGHAEHHVLGAFDGGVPGVACPPRHLRHVLRQRTSSPAAGGCSGRCSWTSMPPWPEVRLTHERHRLRRSDPVAVRPLLALPQGPGAALSTR
jgi:hypothetical protein